MSARPGLELLRNVLELDVEFINRGCSGMGGTFGLDRDRFWTSLRAGRGLLRRLRDGDIEIGATECGACRIQMEQGVTKRTLHPIKLLCPGLRSQSVAAAALQRPQATSYAVVIWRREKSVADHIQHKKIRLTTEGTDHTERFENGKNAIEYQARFWKVCPHRRNQKEAVNRSRLR